MNESNKAMNVYYCETCNTTLVVSQQMDKCGFCEGTVKDIGWVEEK